MSWQKVAELKYAVDEVEPGVFDASQSEGSPGDEFNICIDSDWSAFPRIEINAEQLVYNSLICSLGSGTPLEVIDVTEEKAFKQPRVGVIFLQRFAGDNFDKTYLYLNNEYTGQTLIVNYEYYPEADSFKAISSNLAITASGRCYRYIDTDLSDTNGRLYDLPNIPNGLLCNVADGKPEIWCGGRTLFRYGINYRPAIRFLAAKLSLRRLVVQLAVLFNAKVTYSPNGKLSFSNNIKPRKITVKSEDIISIKTKAFQADADIAIRYRDGLVATGIANRTTLDVPIISEAGVALATARRIKNRRASVGEIYSIKIIGDFDIAPDDVLTFTLNNDSKSKISGKVTRVKHCLDKNITEIETVTIKQEGR